MAIQSLRETRRYVRAHWPTYLGLYAVVVLALATIGVALAGGWYGLVPLALAAFLVAAYWLIASLWTVAYAYDGPGRAVNQILIEYSQLRPDSRVACIDLGLRVTAIHIARRMTTGEVIVVDVYNPESDTGAPLRRARGRSTRPPADPRLTWIDGSTNLLPLADRSVSAVFLNHVLSEFWRPAEREQLLREIWRVLAPEGRLLLAERTRGRANLFLTGLVTYFLPPAEAWRKLLIDADFIIQREEVVRGLVYCVRADRPSPTAAKQLPLLLEFV